jgi:hypothetical protein
MPLLLTLAIIVVVLVVLVLLYLTFVPIIASVQAATCLTTAELAWGFVVIRVLLDFIQGTQRLELRIAGLLVWHSLPEKAVEEVAAALKEEAPTPAARALTVRQATAVLLRAQPEILKLLIAVVRETRIRLRLGLVFGTGDAATTGETFGALMALRGAVSAQPWLAIEATPVFDGPVFDWHAEGEARLRSPIRMILPSVRLFLRVRAIVAQEAARS